MVKDRGLIIDWQKCYNYLLSIEDAFRRDLSNAIFESFYPKNSSLVSIDDCVSENFESDFCFFDKAGKVYYFTDSIDADTRYIIFDWKKISKKDSQKLLYSKSARRKLIAEDREKYEPMLLSRQQIERLLSCELKPRNTDVLLISGFYGDTEDDFSSDSLFAFSEPSETLKEVEEVVHKNSIHSEELYLFIRNFPPRFSFRMDGDWNASKQKRIELNVLLDGLAKQYDLRHYRAKYVYNTRSTRIAEGKWVDVVDSVTFNKAPCNHMFKPYYERFKM